MTWSFQLDPWSAARLAVALTAMLSVPGWLALSATQAWRPWPALTRWFVVVAISIAAYPAFFYLVRAIMPGVVLDRSLLTAVMAVAAAIALWRIWRTWRDQMALSRLEWLAVFILATTLATRFWVIRDWPYPASPDSLHHSLIAQLTIDNGQLPRSLEPYFPVSLDMYHLGLYALAATAALLADVPAHSALLWVAQVLNGLCAIGVYVWLDQRVGRLAAVIGLITAGLLSFQPALLTSWGRFTPLGSQAILLIAIWLLEFGLKGWREGTQRRSAAWVLSVSGLLLAGVFLIHFRVAGYLLPLLLIVLAREAWSAASQRQLMALASGVGLVVAAALVFTFPALVTTLLAYVDYVNAFREPERRQVVEIIQSTYYPFTLAWVNEAGMRTWLLGTAAAAAAVGLWKRLAVTQITVVWLIALYAMGMAYILQIPILQFTNMTAILIALYVPVGVLVGAGAEAAAHSLPKAWQGRARALILVAFLLAAVNSGRARATEFIDRYQLVRAADIPAMNWIAIHTPPDSVFAVNTAYFHQEALYGTDAGYWIPYFTSRRTTAGTMLFTLGSSKYRLGVAQMTETVKAVAADEVELDALRALGITHIYIGVAGSFQEPALTVEAFRNRPGARIVYEQDGVSIIDIQAVSP